MKTTLRNIGDINDFSLDDFGVSKRDYYEMLDAQHFEQEVEVLDNEASWGYYDVILPSGRTVYSLSWYYLNGYISPLFKQALADEKRVYDNERAEIVSQYGLSEYTSTIESKSTGLVIKLAGLSGTQAKMILDVATSLGVKL